MSTPRDLDKKFKDAEVPANETETEKPTDDGTIETESPTERLARGINGEIANDPGEGNIVHRVQDGKGNVTTHGPMPVSEWAEYSAKNDL